MLTVKIRKFDGKGTGVGVAGLTTFWFFKRGAITYGLGENPRGTLILLQSSPNFRFSRRSLPGEKTASQGIKTAQAYIVGLFYFVMLEYYNEIS